MVRFRSLRGSLVGQLFTCVMQASPWMEVWSEGVEMMGCGSQMNQPVIVSTKSLPATLHIHTSIYVQNLLTQKQIYDVPLSHSNTCTHIHSQQRHCYLPCPPAKQPAEWDTGDLHNHCRLCCFLCLFPWLPTGWPRPPPMPEQWNMDRGWPYLQPWV